MLSPIIGNCAGVEKKSIGNCLGKKDRKTAVRWSFGNWGAGVQENTVIALPVINANLMDTDNMCQLNSTLTGLLVRTLNTKPSGILLP